MTPSTREKIAAGLEESLVVADADMLEHADRDDPVERPLDLAIVLHAEADAMGKAALLGAPVGDAPLLLGQRDAGDVDIEILGEIEPEAAPA